MPRLSMGQRRSLVEDYTNGWKQKELAAKYGCSQTRVSQLLKEYKTSARLGAEARSAVRPNSTDWQTWVCAEGYEKAHVCLFDLGTALGGSYVPRDKIVIFSDEWENRKEQCKWLLRAKFGSPEKRIWARKCSVSEITLSEAHLFLDAYHLQGSNRLTEYALGIFEKHELVGVMTLGRHSRAIAKNRIVLDRLCFSNGVRVVGGASKLLKVAALWASSQGYDELISFSDNRWTSGGVYETLGFVLESQLKPDYFYVKNGRRYSKQSQRKWVTGCPENVTEAMWASDRGFIRVHDAGKKRWVLNLRPDQHKTWREKSSECVSQLHSDGYYHHYRVCGYYESFKSQSLVYYASSYELRCFYELERNQEVVWFGRCPPVRLGNSWKSPDLQVKFRDGRTEVWEVKPDKMIQFDDRSITQIEKMREAVEAAGGVFRVWSEADSSLQTSSKIITWAKNYLSAHGKPDRADQVKAQRKAIRDRHYAKIQADKVDVWCDFCKETHTQLRMTYEKNVSRNGGKFICGRYGGHLAGKKPKTNLRKTNPHADEGKKQCSKCKEVKPFEGFDKRAMSWDGYCAQCKACVSVRNKAKYLEKKKRAQQP